MLSIENNENTKNTPIKLPCKLDLLNVPVLLQSWCSFYFERNNKTIRNNRYVHTCERCVHLRNGLLRGHQVLSVQSFAKREESTILNGVRWNRQGMDGVAFIKSQTIISHRLFDLFTKWSALFAFNRLQCSVRSLSFLDSLVRLPIHSCNEKCMTCPFVCGRFTCENSLQNMHK